MANELIIPKNKTKPIKYFIVSLLLCILGLLFITTPEWFIRSNNPGVIKIVGYIFIILFGAFTLMFSQKVFDKQPGMILDNEGFIDNTSGVNTGKVKWKDITEIFIKEALDQRFIMLKVKDPNVYMQREKNPLKIRIMNMNNSLYETPINISPKGLKISFEALLRKLKEHT